MNGQKHEKMFRDMTCDYHRIDTKYQKAVKLMTMPPNAW